MIINPRQFADNLNRCLDEADYPHKIKDRADILVDVLNEKYDLNIDKFYAQQLIEGKKIPDDNLVNALSHEFEVQKEELTGHKPPRPSR